MATFDLEYAQEHLTELFHDARLGMEVIIVREDGKSCELTPLAEVRSIEPIAGAVAVPHEPEELSGDLIPA